MPKIFLNYRTDDAGFGVTYLDEQLSQKFGTGAVFLDSKSIQAGADWKKTMFDAIAASTALLVVMGHKWLDPRLDDPEDFVRLEILMAFELCKPVIPVRLDCPRLQRHKLPEPLRRLIDCQDVEVRFRNAKIDVDMLADKLRQQIPELAEVASVGPERSSAKYSVHAKTIDKLWQGDNMTFTGDFYAGPLLGRDDNR